MTEPTDSPVEQFHPELNKLSTELYVGDVLKKYRDEPGFVHLRMKYEPRRIYRITQEEYQTLLLTGRVVI